MFDWKATLDMEFAREVPLRLQGIENCKTQKKDVTYMIDFEHIAKADIEDQQSKHEFNANVFETVETSIATRANERQASSGSTDKVHPRYNWKAGVLLPKVLCIDIVKSTQCVEKRQEENLIPPPKNKRMLQRKRDVEEPRCLKIVAEHLAYLASLKNRRSHQCVNNI